ncbi:MAG: hypothetical protein ABS939_24925, partial [Psychrobacillus sp.]
LEANDANILLVEPNIQTLPEKLAAGTLVSLSDAANSADIVAILVAHQEFKDKTILNDVQVMNMVSNI